MELTREQRQRVRQLAKRVKAAPRPIVLPNPTETRLALDRTLLAPPGRRAPKE